MYDDLLIVVDICLCEYIDYGYCGVIDDYIYDVDNDKLLLLFVKIVIF